MAPKPTGDKTMLINCVAYQEGKKLADISVADISKHVCRPDCFVWVALRDASDDELATMQHEFGLHDLAVEDARHGHQRPKVEEYGDTLFVVMHTVEFSAIDELHVGELNVFVGRNFVLSVRNRSQHSMLDVRERAERDPHLLRHGAGFVLYALMDAVVDRYFPIIDTMETDLEGIEHLYGLKRRIMVVKHAVTPLMESTGKLSSGRVPSVCEGSRDYFRDVYDHLLRINATLDTLRDTIGTAIQVNLAMVTIEESETTKRLAAWAGIFAVATAFAGIWGMNFERMPELKLPYGYPMALGLIVVACSVMYWRFRKVGWL
jgi:magnesium transporter